MKRVMTVERRVSMCKMKRSERMSESRLTNKSTTEYEKREDAARQFLDVYPHFALVREGLSVKVLPMTPVSHRKPCAGNPHARFEEGASALGEPEAECSTPPDFARDKYSGRDKRLSYLPLCAALAQGGVFY